MRLTKWLLLLGMLLLLPAMALADTTITITFTGDVTLGGEARLEAEPTSFKSVYEKEGPEYFLKNFADFFAEDDLTVVNLEGVLTDNLNLPTQQLGKTGSYFFRGLPEYTKVLTSASVEAASIANNHILDYGDPGLEDTVQALEAAGIKWFGTRQRHTTPYEQFLFYEKDGVTICLMSLYWDDYMQGDPTGSGAFLSEEIQRIKAEGKADAVIAILHGGQEYGRHATRPQKVFTAMAFKAGADLVICHHAHVVMGMDVIGNRSAFYSLGNFCFGGNKNAYQQTAKRVQDAAPALIVRAALTFDDEGNYKGQQMTLYPVQTTSVDRPVNSILEQPNTYQPKFVTGRLAAQVMRLIHIDTNYSDKDKDRPGDKQNQELEALLIQTEKDLKALDTTEGMTCLTLPYLPAE